MIHRFRLCGALIFIRSFRRVLAILFASEKETLKLAIYQTDFHPTLQNTRAFIHKASTPAVQSVEAINTQQNKYTRGDKNKES